LNFILATVRSILLRSGLAGSVVSAPACWFASAGCWALFSVSCLLASVDWFASVVPSWGFSSSNIIPLSSGSVNVISSIPIELLF